MNFESTGENFEINVYFAKFIICPRYITYITHILNTEMKTFPKIDIRFYANRMRWIDRNNLTPVEAINAIKLLVAQLSKNLTLELKQDFIDDFVMQGKC